jgi:outer membrane receptor protein involved in Fe transport
MLAGGAWLDTEILVDPEDPEHEGLPTRGAPKWSGFVMTNYTFAREHPLKGLTLGLGANYQDATRTADQLTQFLRVTEPVTLVDAFVAYRIERFKHPVIVRLNVSNALDEIKLARDKNWTEPREFRCHVGMLF